MEKIKKYSLSIGIYISLILIFSFFINLLNYFNILSENSYKIFLVLLVSINMFISAFILGKNTQEKGYLEGIKLGLILIILMITISYLSSDILPSIKSIIYYLILLLSSIIGSTFGINIKKEKTQTVFSKKIIN